MQTIGFVVNELSEIPSFPYRRIPLTLGRSLVVQAQLIQPGRRAKIRNTRSGDSHTDSDANDPHGQARTTPYVVSR